ncbi:uncharacterized protein LOC110809371 [Carica papaya]|uniref:uncharacterized protein LOC110809371 n=1 Tax=Carica papaya TaxID=3649 RepID=UPI000B8D0068|nr:uncharacterized protein LOC110809371 [Carica papaya]
MAVSSSLQKGIVITVPVLVLSVSAAAIFLFFLLSSLSTCDCPPPPQNVAVPVPAGGDASGSGSFVEKISPSKEDIQWIQDQIRLNGLHMQENVLRKGINPRTRAQQLQDLNQLRAWKIVLVV